MHRLSHRLLTLALVALFAPCAAAQFTRDAAANRKIDEAVNTHYLATDFDKAEAVLTGTIKACEDKCRPQTLARAWMYVGIVRGSGRNDQAGAGEAFRNARALDADVKLDAGLATPETQATFGQHGGGGSTEAPPPTPATDTDQTPQASDTNQTPQTSEETALVCTPEVSEVETRRAIPVQCQSQAQVTSVDLRYKPVGSNTWKTIRLEHKGQTFRGQIPCEDTQTAGSLELYANGKDAEGETIAGWGTKAAPLEIQLVEQSSEAPPSFDDSAPPARCAATEICPPDFPGCEGGKRGGSLDWGAACNNSTECKSGLLCIDGTCETAPSCSTTSDCPAGTCVDGKCAIRSDDGSGNIVGPFKKIWIGLNVAQDIALVGGDSPCRVQDADGFSCYYPDSTTIPYDPNYFGNTAAGNIGTGTVAATTRILLNFDYAITANVTAGVRVGYAFRGGPPAKRRVTYTSTDEVASVVNPGKSFLPFHAEVRGAYWFGKNPLARRGFRPYLNAGAGIAQVDAKVSVDTHEECRARVPRPTAPACAEPNDVRSGDFSADAWKKLGPGFIQVGGGAGYAFTPGMVAQLSLNAMYMLGTAGLVLQPSLGLVLGL